MTEVQWFDKLTTRKFMDTRKLKIAVSTFRTIGIVGLIFYVIYWVIRLFFFIPFFRGWLGFFIELDIPFAAQKAGSLLYFDLHYIFISLSVLSFFLWYYFASKLRYGRNSSGTKWTVFIKGKVKRDMKNTFQTIGITTVTFAITLYVIYFVVPVSTFYRIYGEDAHHPFHETIELPPQLYF